MQIAVIGAGFTGVCAALELARAGHAVQVFERQGSIASQSSFADAGLMLPAGLAGLAPPSGPWWRKLGRQGARAGSPEAASREQAMTQLAMDSASVLAELTALLRLDYQHTLGWQLLVGQARDRDTLARDVARLEAAGIPHEWLDGEQARAKEPALHAETPLAGALRLPQVPIINTRQLAQQLRLAAQRAGVRFHLGAEVIQLTPGLPARLHWRRDTDAPPTGHAADTTPSEGNSSFDAVLLCTGTDTPRLTKPLGLRLPMRPAGGCSLTVPLHLPEALPDPGPAAAVTDLGTGISFTRLGDRLRVTALWAEPGDHGQARKETVDALYAALETWFPGAARHGHGLVWQGTHPRLVDGAPAVGASGLPGVWLNVGHGEHGTALAMGCARALQAMLSERTPAMDCTALSPLRFR